MRKVYCCNARLYDDHFLQTGKGLPIFIGSKGQRGYGLGGIFSSIAKAAIPMLKSAAKSAGKTLLKSGAEFASDVLQGRNVKEAAKQRAINAGKTIGRDLLSSTVQHVSGSHPASNKKRKVTKNPISRKKAKRQRTSKNTHPDIFI